MTRVDAHVHVVNFQQHLGEPADLMRALDRAGADRAVVSGAGRSAGVAASTRPTCSLSSASG